MPKKPTNVPDVTITPGDSPPAPEVLAQAIVDIAEGIKALNASRLRRSAIVTLLHESTKVGKKDILAVLRGLDTLEKDTLWPLTS